jgi:oligopeptide transport system ATP-binding protein
MSNFPILEVKGLSISYKKHKTEFFAVDNVSFDIFEGETLALVGESGCGKSSIAKALLGIAKITDGKILYKGTLINKERRKVSIQTKKDIQMIFQDPYSSLNPRMTIEEIIKEPLLVYGIGDKSLRNGRIEEIMESVKLPKSYKKRYPHELSGGERQRVSIARALVSKPKVLVCDEPTHALDVSVQASIINLLKDLRDEFKLSLLFISHDLALVKNVSDRCLVMYRGKIVEEGLCESIFSNPLHPFTKTLLGAIPVFGKDPHPFVSERLQEVSREYINTCSVKSMPQFVKELQNSVTAAFKRTPINSDVKEKKCPYFERCTEKKGICTAVYPPLQKLSTDHQLLCNLKAPKP